MINRANQNWPQRLIELIEMPEPQEESLYEQVCRIATKGESNNAATESNSLLPKVR